MRCLISSPPSQNNSLISNLFHSTGQQFSCVNIRDVTRGDGEAKTSKRRTEKTGRGEELRVRRGEYGLVTTLINMTKGVGQLTICTIDRLKITLEHTAILSWLVVNADWTVRK